MCVWDVGEISEVDEVGAVGEFDGVGYSAEVGEVSEFLRLVNLKG